MSRTKRRMSASLPRTPCLPEMRDRLIAIAEKQGRSIVDVQREAISVFLSKFDTECIGKDTTATILQ